MIVGEDSFDQLRVIGEFTFTPREIDCLACIFSGRSSKFIASLFSLSVRTVEAHVHNIMLKIGCGSRQHLITFIEKAHKEEPFRRHYYSCLRKRRFENALKDTRTSIKQKPIWFIFNFSHAISRSSRVRVKLLETHLECLGHKVTSKYKEDGISGKLIITKYHKDNGEKTSPLTEIDFSDLEENYYKTAIDFFSNFLSKEIMVKIRGEVDEDEGEMEDKTEKNDGKEKRPNRFYRGKNKVIIAGCFVIFISLLFIKIWMSFFMEKESPYNNSNLVSLEGSHILNRKKLMDTIEAKLNRQKGIKSVILMGIGGSGKTTLARGFARSKKNICSLEILAENPQTTINSFRESAYILAKTEAQQRELDWIGKIRHIPTRDNKIVRFVRDRLRDQKEWILIYDNVHSFVSIQDYIPRDEVSWGNGSVIITTQNSNIEHSNLFSPDAYMAIGELSTDEALTILLKILSITEPLSPKMFSELRECLKVIPHFPLDVSIAGNFIKNTHILPRDYAKKMKQYSSRLQDSEPSLLQEMGISHLTRNDIILNSLKSILEIKPEFKEIALNIFILDSQNIMEEIICLLKDKMIVKELIFYLKKYSLVSTMENRPKSFSIHRSTQKIALDYLLDDLNTHKNTVPLEEIYGALEKYGREIMDRFDYKRMKLFLPHLKEILSKEYLPNTSKKEELRFILGCHYLYLNDFKAAKKIFEGNIHRLSKNDDKISRARNLEYLGNTYKFLGKYLAAKQSLREPFDIFIKVQEG